MGDAQLWGGDGSVPMGTLVPVFGAVEPSPFGPDWIVCDGRSSPYPWAAMSGGSTTIVTPDLRGWGGAPNWMLCVNGQGRSDWTPGQPPIRN